VAQVSAPLVTTPVELADEPAYDDVTWVSSYAQDPFEVPLPDKVAVLVDWSRRLRRHPTVEHATAELLQVHENNYYADLGGTRTTQQRVRLHPTFTAMGSDAERGVFDDMRSIAPPTGRGWEYIVGSTTDGAWDWDSELAEVPDLLAQKLAAPSVAAGTYDLAIPPSHLWPTIPESIRQPTKLD